MVDTIKKSSSVQDLNVELDQKISNCEFRSGIVSVLGRPNAGKSSLCNRLVGKKVGIVSRHPHTTRKRLWGICNGNGYQLVLADTPGVRLKMNNRLEQKMETEVRKAASGAQHHLFVVDALRATGSEQRALESLLCTSGVVWGVVSKIDIADHHAIQRCKKELQRLKFVERVFLVSALTGEGIEELKDALTDCLPKGQVWFPFGETSIQSKQVHLAELIREQLLKFVRQELPHETTVLVEKWTKKDALVSVWASIYTKRNSQKAILIGHQGRMISKIGKAARLSLQNYFGNRVHLDLQVISRANWADNSKFLSQ